MKILLVFKASGIYFLYMITSQSLHYLLDLIWTYFIVYINTNGSDTRDLKMLTNLFYYLLIILFFFWYKIHWAVKRIILMQWCKHTLTCCSDLWQTFIVKLQNSSSQNLFAQHRVCHLLLLVHEENPVNTQKT